MHTYCSTYGGAAITMLTLEQLVHELRSLRSKLWVKASEIDYTISQYYSPEDEISLDALEIVMDMRNLADKLDILQKKITGEYYAYGGYLGSYSRYRPSE